MIDLFLRDSLSFNRLEFYGVIAIGTLYTDLGTKEFIMLIAWIALYLLLCLPVKVWYQLVYSRR